jgi:quinol monooxygenase YgiN
MKYGIAFLLICLPVFGMSCKQKPAPVQPQAEATSNTKAPDYQKIIQAKVFIKEGNEAAFIEAAKTIIENSNKEEGCLYYQLFQSPYEKTNFIFVERYRNQAAIDFHFGTQYFKEFGEKIGNLTTKPTEIVIYDVAGEKKQ